NYNEILKQKYAAFTNVQLKDGVYLDYVSFFEQKPVEYYQLVKNNGEVIRAVDAKDDRIPARKFFCYVENGKAYKNTAIGFLALNKDEKGYFVQSNLGILSPEEIKISVFYVLAGGIVGGVVGGVVEGIRADVKLQKAMKEEKYNIYVDFLNGEYIFRQ
ncbi:MAG: hypothetical protein H7195_09970, partial [Chryseobacterium sp.]|nr:hypothetical protein [Chryseobacterium sp.]